MGNDDQTIPRISGTVNRRTLAGHIARWREHVIDHDSLVDDKRRAVDHAVHELRLAVRERDRAADRLAHLLELHEQIEVAA